LGGGVLLTVQRVHVALDATALGSGRGGDETYMRGILHGLVATADDDDRVSIFTRRSATVPDHPTFRVRRIRPSGSLRLLGPLSASATRVNGLFVGYTHLPVGLRKPAALVVTDLSFRHHPEHYPRAARARLNALVPRQARSSGGVFTISEFCRRDLIESYGLDPARVHVVPCAVESPVPLGDTEALRLREWAKTKGIDRPFVVYLGNLHPRKNVALLVRAFRAARLQGVQLVIAGATWWKGGGEEVAAREADDGTIVVVGGVDAKQQSYLLRHAHALAYPSLFEGFGLPPLEAMSVGTPVLASDAAAIPETCGDAAHLVDARHMDALMEGLERIVHDEQLRATLGTRGPRRASVFTSKRTGRQFRDACARVVERTS
jgi:glycosyltransferase involved in cell wall biosynthesis